MKADADHWYEADTVSWMSSALTHERGDETVEQMHQYEPAQEVAGSKWTQFERFGNNVKEGYRDQHTGGEAHKINTVFTAPDLKMTDGIDADARDQCCQNTGAKRRPEAVFHVYLRIMSAVRLGHCTS